MLFSFCFLPEVSVFKIIPILVGISSVSGHNWPIFLKFKGGKGVATALGVFLALSWPVALAMILTWLLVAYGLKISSMSALVASALSPFYFWWLNGSNIFIIMSFFITVLLFWRHRTNIKRLLEGTEK